MSLMKSELKAAGIHEVGSKLEDSFEASKLEFAESKGIRAGFDFAARRIEQMSLALDKQAQGEAPSVSPEDYKIAKLWIGQCHAAMLDEVKRATETAFRAQGKVAALEQVVKQVGGMLKAEEAKIDALKTGMLVEEGKGIPGEVPGDAQVLPIHRVTGTHPGNPVAALKAREEPVVPPKPVEPLEESSKPRKGRPKKGS